MRVLIFGSRNWRDRQPIRELIAELPHHAVIVHGAHWEGADKIADEEAKMAGLRVEPYPAHWNQEGPPAGPNRNSRMAKAKLDFAFGFRREGKSNGTDDMEIKARRAGVHTHITHNRNRGGRTASQVLNSWEQLTIDA